MSDAIKKPAHYNQGPIECIDAMKIVLTPEEFRGYLKGNVFKYLWREKDKNGIEDLRKGREYYDRLIQLFDESEQQPVIKQSLITQPPDGWRWLEVGEVIRKGDKPVYPDGEIKEIHPSAIGKRHEQPTRSHCRVIRRNKFEVGEKVFSVLDDMQFVVVGRHQQLNDQYFLRSVTTGMTHSIFAKLLAPYIEATVEVTGEVKPPDGWRWLEVGEVVRKGDRFFFRTDWKDRKWGIGEKYSPIHQKTIRRNKFEVGEKVVEFINNRIGVVKDIEAIGSGKAVLYHVEMQDTKGMILFSLHQLAPYIEEQS